MPWQRLKRSTVIDSKWLRVFRDTYQLPRGGLLDDYYVVERSDFVLVVAGDAERIVLVRQYRPATEKYYWSLPAGYIGNGEAPEQAAVRELQEETGLRAGSARKLMTLDPLPGYLKSSACIVRCFCSDLTVDIEDTDEIAEARLVTWPEALEMIRTGSIDEMQAVSALLVAQQFESL
jgi:ADP-ribose pyrophosphatase